MAEEEHGVKEGLRWLLFFLFFGKLETWQRTVEELWIRVVVSSTGFWALCQPGSAGGHLVLCLQTSMMFKRFPEHW